MIRRTLLAIAALFLAAFAFTAIAQDAFPKLTGRVVDSANLLNASREAALTAQLKAHEDKSGQQVVVATIPSLNGNEISDYGNRLFRAWALGDEKRNDGVLLLVAKDDRKLRIEVGYGLEGTLTDALSSYIIRTAIVPAFKQGQFAVGIQNGASEILNVLSADEAGLEEWQSRARPRKSKRNDEPTWPAFAFMTIWLLIFFGGPLSIYLAKKFGKKLGPNRYSWLGMEFNTGKKKRRRNSNGTWVGGSGGGWGSGGGFGGGGGGFGGGGGSSGGGGASGGW